jgi:thiol-disulfide isomerase/thioredoxin
MSTHPKIIDKVDNKSLNTVIKDISSRGCILLYHWKDCGYCRSFMPIWDKLKEKYGNIKQFYEIELTTIRQAPDVFKSITGYPTIVAYVGNGSSNKIRFHNSRDEKTVSQFIEENVPDYDKAKSKSIRKTPYPKAKTGIKKKK